VRAGADVAGRAKGRQAASRLVPRSARGSQLPAEVARFTVSAIARRFRMDGGQSGPGALCASLTWEPPIGIEPMTYALREGSESSRTVRCVARTLLAGLLVPLTSRVI